MKHEETRQAAVSAAERLFNWIDTQGMQKTEFCAHISLARPGHVLKKSTFQHWLRIGIPAAWAYPVEMATGGHVTRDSIAPHLIPARGRRLPAGVVRIKTAEPKGKTDGANQDS